MNTRQPRSALLFLAHLAAAGLFFWPAPGCREPPAETPQAPAASPEKRDRAQCSDSRTLRRPDGDEIPCYPYRCRDNRCLRRCESMRDCAGTQKPGPLDEGWPLECIVGECVPMPPEKVHPSRR